jgi:hypothetical protein
MAHQTVLQVGMQVQLNIMIDFCVPLVGAKLLCFGHAA